jgi:ribosomal protein S18 acetylase RimI-like enzyme
VLIVRVLSSPDAAAFRELRLQALAEDPATFASTYEDERDTPLSVVAERIAPARDRAIVGAFDGPDLVGLAAWHREETEGLEHQGFVWGVFVAPSHRGRGLARRLMRRVIGLARRAQGITELTLVAYADNGHALALYESLGFVIHGRQPTGSGIDCRPEDLHMRLRL